MATWRKMFGPSREEIWRQLSTQIEASYVKGGFARADKVQAVHGQWIVTLDTHAVSAGKTVIIYTRMRAPYINPDGFRFTIYRKGTFSEFAKWFGMQDIAIGQEPFDTDFIVKGTDETRLRELFAVPKLRDLIAAQPQLHLTVKDDEGWFGPHFPDGVDELCFTVPTIIKDLERLKSLYGLFAETLDQLTRMGSAYERSPGIEL